MQTRRSFLAGAAAGAATLAGARAFGWDVVAAAAPTRPPNILILMNDQERAPQWTPDLPLPARDWIDARGVTFDRFHHSAVQCSPSRACIWTGLYTPQNGIFGNFLQDWQLSLDPRIPTLGDLMREQGYETAYFGKWHLSMAGTSLPEGPVDNIKGNYLGPYGFDYSRQSTSLEPAGYNDGVYSDPLWTKEGIDWLREHGGQRRPWLCVVSLLNPHDIAYFPRGYTVDVKRPDWEVELPPNYDDDFSTKPKVHQQYQEGAGLVRGRIDRDDRATWLRLLNTYCDLIVNSDDNLAALLKALGDSGGLEDTLIVRMSDHGELAGSHRLSGKGPMMYDEQLRMPLTFAWPSRFAQGARTTALAEAVDLVPTLLEIAGVPDPASRYPWLRGHSLVAALDDPENGRTKEATVSICDENWAPEDFAGIGPTWKRHLRAAMSDQYKIGRYFAITGAGSKRVEHTDEQELEAYDIREDPLELRNLARDPAYKGLVDDLHAWLRELEAERLKEVEIPSYGPPALVQPLREEPVDRPLDPVAGEVELPQRSGAPGAYIPLPIEDPHLERLVYDDGGGRRRARTADATRELAEARARQRAAMLCEMGPKHTMRRR